MRYKRRSGFTSCLLLLILLGLFILIGWLFVPMLAERSFGSPADYLSGFSRWNFSLQTLLHRNNLISPVSLQEQKVNFSIDSAESIASISRRLEQSGLIRSAAGFRAYLVYKGFDSQIKAGDFQLDASKNSLEIADSIQAAYSPIVPFYIYPGWRAEEIAAALPSSGIEVYPDDFLEIVYNPSILGDSSFLSDQPTLNGFLFPGQYNIDREISAQELVLIFISRFQEKVSSEVIDAINKQGLDLYQGITLASIIQRETFEDDERALMASVFYNRLRGGIKLETDPTVQYALGYSETWGGWWKTPLKTNDLKVDSSFNTYQISGLPPTPISNPDLPSILAVAFPEESPYYFFRATCDGSGLHQFSITFEEHLQKECK